MELSEPHQKQLSAKKAEACRGEPLFNEHVKRLRAGLVWQGQQWALLMLPMLALAQPDPPPQVQAFVGVDRVFDVWPLNHELDKT